MKIDRTTENVATLLPFKILEHYKDIHLDIDILYINQTVFLLTISRDIGFIHCRPMSSNVTKKIQNPMRQIPLDYQAREFTFVSAFSDSEFDNLKDWTRDKLHINLDTCAVDSHVPRAKNAIRFVKERLRSILYKTLSKKYPKRLTSEMTRRHTVLINSFRRKSGVRAVMLPRQILFREKFKTPLCKRGELVLAYDVKSDNKTSEPRAFHALYIYILDLMMQALVTQYSNYQQIR